MNTKKLAEVRRNIRLLTDSQRESWIVDELIGAASAGPKLILTCSSLLCAEQFAWLFCFNALTNANPGVGVTNGHRGHRLFNAQITSANV